LVLEDVRYAVATELPRQRLRVAARYAGVRPAKAPLELLLIDLTGKKFSA